MGIIVNQSVKGNIYSYIGVILGFITTGILLQQLFSTEQVGLTKNIVAYTSLVAQLGTLGFGGVTIRLFPYFKDSKSKHHGFLSLALITGMLGFVFTMGLFFILKSLFAQLNSGDTAQLMEYQTYLIILVFFQIYYFLFDSYYSALLNSIHGTFLREVFQRVLIIAGIGLFYFNLLDFHQFIVFYIASMSLPTLVIMATLIIEGQFSLKTDFVFLKKPLLISMGIMALFSILNGLSMIIIQTVDTLMITGMIGLSDAGIYAVCFFFGIFVSLPGRSILKITNIVSADAWKRGDLKEIETIYKKSCLTLFIIGLLVFMGLWANIGNVFLILRPEYAPGKWVIFFIGLGSLIDMSTGANSSILGTSPFYKAQTVFLILLVVLLIISNLLFIPVYGITGAAIGGAVSLTILNLLRFLFLWYKYNLQPFNLKFISVALIGGCAYFISSLLPELPNFIADIFVRSTMLTVLFCLPVYLLKISPDINEKADEWLRMVGISR